MNKSSRNTKRVRQKPLRTFVRRRTFVLLLVLSAFFAILLIAKSTTLSVARDLEFVDHRFGEPSTIRLGAQHNNTVDKNNSELVPRRSRESPRKEKHQVVTYDNPPLSQPAISVCFIASQFSSSRDKTDHLFDVRKTTPRLYRSPLYNFFAFSNLADLQAPGWTVVVKDLRAYKRWITQSRWAKFLAFREPIIRDTCEVVYYIDGILSPRDDIELFQAESRKILDSPVQLAQRKHPYGGGAEAEFERILSKRKDLKKNVEASRNWLRKQQDYDTNCTLYENSMFGYSIDSDAFKKAAYYFWHHYSKEEDSWRGKNVFETNETTMRFSLAPHYSALMIFSDLYCIFDLRNFVDNLHATYYYFVKK